MNSVPPMQEMISCHDTFELLVERAVDNENHMKAPKVKDRIDAKVISVFKEHGDKFNEENFFAWGETLMLDFTRDNSKVLQLGTRLFGFDELSIGDYRVEFIQLKLPDHNSFAKFTMAFRNFSVAASFRKIYYDADFFVKGDLMSSPEHSFMSSGMRLR